jgi:hypothetical protein
MHTSLVRPVVKYSAPVLNSYKKQQISQVEQIQRKVATCRYVFDDYCDRSPGSVTNMIDILQIECVTSQNMVHYVQAQFTLLLCIINKNNYLHICTVACYMYLKVGWESFKCYCGDIYHF